MAVAGRPSAQRTTTTVSFDGPLGPQLFFARMRTSYVPAATPLATNVAAALRALA